MGGRDNSVPRVPVIFWCTWYLIIILVIGN